MDALRSRLVHLVVASAAAAAGACGPGRGAAPAPPAPATAPQASDPAEGREDAAAADAVAAAIRAHEVLASVSVVPAGSARLAEAALTALATALAAGTGAAVTWTGDPERDRAILRDRATALVARATAAAPPDLALRVARAMAAVAGDPHAFAVDSDALGSLLASISGEPFPGLGFTVHAAAAGQWVVSGVHPGGPAETAGLRRGDLVVAIDGGPLDAARFAELGRILRTEQKVPLLVARGDGGDAAPVRLELIAARHRPPIVDSRVLPGKVGYLRIHYLPHSEDPAGDAAILVAGALDELDRARVKSLVVDLRDSAGGAPFDVASILVRGDPLLRVLVPGEDTVPLARTAQPWKVRRKMAVLINDQTYAGAEMVALALRDHGEARLFGLPSAGALTVPGQAPLPGGVILFFPQALVVGASAAPLPDRRLAPDQEVANAGPAEYAAGRDPQLDAAAAWLRQR